MNPETFAKLRRQAQLQVRGRESRQPIYELLRARAAARLRAAAGAVGGRRLLRYGGRPALRAGPRARISLRLLDARRRAGRFARSGALDARRREARVRSLRRLHRRAPSRAIPPCTSTTTRATKSRRCGGSRKSTARARDEVDDLLRDEVLVDLYAVVRQVARRSRKTATASRSVERFYDLDARDRRQEGRRVDRHVRALAARTATNAILDDIEALQPRRLPLDLSSARVAAGTPAGGHRPSSASIFRSDEHRSSAPSARERKRQESAAQRSRATAARERAVTEVRRRVSRCMSDDRRARYLLGRPPGLPHAGSRNRSGGRTSTVAKTSTTSSSSIANRSPDCACANDIASERGQAQ